MLSQTVTGLVAKNQRQVAAKMPAGVVDQRNLRADSVAQSAATGRRSAGIASAAAQGFWPRRTSSIETGGMA